MTTTSTRRSIVAGIDGSDDSLAALDWAAELASARGLPLDLVHCAPSAPPAHSRAPGQAVLAEATTRCRLTAPEVLVRASVTAAAPAGTLIERSGAAELVVVGAAGTDHSTGLGSVADVVASYAHCPVVVVRPGSVIPAAGRPVIVGIDGDCTSTRVLGFAFEEAARRHTRLVALHGWTYRGELTGSGGDPSGVIASALTGWHDKHPEVEVEERPVHAAAAVALAVESRGAALVVVGAHGRPGAGCAVLGPVSQELLGQAWCPVAVVRAIRSPSRPHPWLRSVGSGGER